MTGQEPLLEPTALGGHLGASHGTASHAGRVRQLNEDRCFAAPEMGIYAVADGMGGHEAGEVASSAVVEQLATIGPAVTPNDLMARLEDRMLRAHTAIRRIGHLRGRTVGTTVAILLTFERHFACLWAGDSRVYQIRGTRIVQLSRDHTEAQALIDDGTLTAEEARTWPRRNIITRAVGVRPELELELLNGVLEPADAFVICSDGLTTHVEANDILGCVGILEPQQACDALVALALERGGSDNVTVVIVRFASEPDSASVATSDEANEVSP